MKERRIRLSSHYIDKIRKGKQRESKEYPNMVGSTSAALAIKLIKPPGAKLYPIINKTQI